MLAIELLSQKLASRKLLNYESFHDNHDIVYDETELIFFMNTIAQPNAKKLTEVRRNLLILNCNILKTANAESSNLVTMHFRLIATF